MGGAQFYTHRPVTAFEIQEEIMLEPIVLPKAAQESVPATPLPSTFLNAFKLVIKLYLTMEKLPIGALASEILNIHVSSDSAPIGKRRE